MTGVSMREFAISGRRIGPGNPPFIIAEVGINHEGEYSKAVRLVDAAVRACADCVKFQCHITDKEMIYTDMKPGKISKERLWDIIKRCELTESEEKKIRKYCREKKIINLSTGMNDIKSIRVSVNLFRKYKIPLMLMHCVSMYPTPYNNVRLPAISQLREEFNLPVGLSDHSSGIYICLGAVALGAVALEKHFTIKRSWPGPDNPISIEPGELRDLVKGSRAVWEAMKGRKEIQPKERPVIDFAYASVVTISPVGKGEFFSLKNIWVKRPGTGDFLAKDFDRLLKKKANRDLPAGVQVKREDVK